MRINLSLKVRIKSFEILGDMMKKTTIIFLSIGLAAIITFAGFIYISFNGVPWKKTQVAQELEQYIEKKYNTDVEVVEKYYNFKDGSYAATFKGQVDNIEFTFNTEKTSSGNYSDYYVEGLWASQLRADSEPIIKQYFNSLSIESTDYHFIYGIADVLKIQSNDIPNYKTVNSDLSLVLHLNDYFSEDTKNKGISETYTLIQQLKMKGIDNIGVFINYKMTEEEIKMGRNYRIFIEPGELKNIQTEEDIENYLIEL